MCERTHRHRHTHSLTHILTHSYILLSRFLSPPHPQNADASRHFLDLAPYIGEERAHALVAAATSRANTGAANRPDDASETSQLDVLRVALVDLIAAFDAVEHVGAKRSGDDSSRESGELHTAGSAARSTPPAVRAAGRHYSLDEQARGVAVEIKRLTVAKAAQREAVVALEESAEAAAAEEARQRSELAVHMASGTEYSLESIRRRVQGATA